MEQNRKPKQPSHKMSTPLYRSMGKGLISQWMIQKQVSICKKKMLLDMTYLMTRNKINFRWNKDKSLKDDNGKYDYLLKLYTFYQLPMTLPDFWLSPLYLKNRSHYSASDWTFKVQNGSYITILTQGSATENHPLHV